MKKYLLIVLALSISMLLVGYGVSEKFKLAAVSNEILVAAASSEKTSKPPQTQKPDNEPFNDPQRNAYDGGP